MSTNQLYDIIVIGASEDGIKFCKQILDKTVDVKIALVSRSFNYPLDFTDLDIINKEVIFSSYNRGLIGLTLADKSTLFCKNIIIATGTKPVRSSLKNCNIQYNLNKVVPSKSSPAVVFGNDDLAASYAIALSKKFKYVYLCTNILELSCSSKYIKKIENIANIVHLPNCNIIGCKNDKEGKLVEVQLDTYSSIRCTALIMSLGRTPDNPGLSKRMIETDSEGYIKIHPTNETTIIPTIYAIGSCVKDSKTKLTTIVNNIITKNNFKLKN
jgi:thioredoxin reductase